MGGEKLFEFVDLGMECEQACFPAEVGTADRARRRWCLGRFRQKLSEPLVVMVESIEALTDGLFDLGESPHPVHSCRSRHRSYLRQIAQIPGSRDPVPKGGDISRTWQSLGGQFFNDFWDSLLVACPMRWV